MPRPIAAVIHMGSLRHNLNRMREAAGNRTLWAVVKANAYGHGLLRAMHAFEAADGLAMIDICDAEMVRAYGWEKRILLLEGFFDETDLPVLQKLDIETIVHNREMIEMIRKNAPYESLKVHVKINSGMNRLGFLPEQEQAVFDELKAIEGVQVMGVVTHFANAEPSYRAQAPVSVQKQLSRMGELANMQEGVCLSNSAALLWHPQVQGDAVRAGVALYGVSPDASISSDSLGILPAMTLRSKILAIQTINEGDAVGYGSRFVAKRPTRIAIVACGYADGYPRRMPDGAPTYVEGQIAPIAGAVAMDMLSIDVTDIAQAKVGSDVELWGKHVSINALAQLSGTIGYELMCALTLRVPKLQDNN